MAEQPISTPNERPDEIKALIDKEETAEDALSSENAYSEHPDKTAAPFGLLPERNSRQVRSKVSL